MSVLVDTGVFYAAFDSDASRHDAARGALRTVLTDGSYGRIMTTDYVYDETVTLTADRTGSTQRAIAIGDRLRGASSEWGDSIQLRFITKDVFDAAVQVFEQYDDQSLSFTDASIIACCERADVDAVLSFDDDFDGLVDRISPATVGN